MTVRKSKLSTRRRSEDALRGALDPMRTASPQATIAGAELVVWTHLPRSLVNSLERSLLDEELLARRGQPAAFVHVVITATTGSTPDVEHGHAQEIG